MSSDNWMALRYLPGPFLRGYGWLLPRLRLPSVPRCVFSCMATMEGTLASLPNCSRGTVADVGGKE